MWSDKGGHSLLFEKRIPASAVCNVPDWVPLRRVLDMHKWEGALLIYKLTRVHIIIDLSGLIYSNLI